MQHTVDTQVLAFSQHAHGLGELKHMSPWIKLDIK